MASSREDRRLQRQRGAGRHQVDVDFGSPFPTATVSQQRMTRSGATPQPDLPPQASNERTPASRRRRSPSNATSTQRRETLTPNPTSIDANRSANTSAKRRKLNSPPDAPSSSPTKSTRSRPTTRRELYDLEGEPIAEGVQKRTLGQALGDSGNLEDELHQIQQTETPKSRRFSEPSTAQTDEITESPRHAPGSGQRHQSSFGETQMPGNRFSGAVREATPSAQQGVPVAKMSSMLAYRQSPRNYEVPSATEDVDEPSPDQPNRSRLEFQRQFSDVEAEEEEVIDDVETTKRLQKKRKWKASRGRKDLDARANEVEPDEEQDDVELSTQSIVRPTKVAKQRGKPRAKGSPASQRQPKKSKLKSASKQSGEIIPVIVHRLTKPVLHGEDDTDADILNEDIPFSKRSGVNAVDVLSQFCEEVVESGLEALEEGGSNTEDPAARREYRTKLRAVEAFQEELRTRLLELTVILDQDYLLNKRVHAAQKEKIQLREELLRLRAEREQLALRMDEVRIKHENSSKEAQEQAILNNSLHDIELAVSRGLEKAPTGGIHEPAPPELSILLKTVAAEISSNSPEGGILKRVKDFNTFLERAALALETR